jgi:hypothetical protein
MCIASAISGEENELAAYLKEEMARRGIVHEERDEIAEVSKMCCVISSKLCCYTHG